MQPSLSTWGCPEGERGEPSSCGPPPHLGLRGRSGVAGPAVAPQTLASPRDAPPGSGPRGPHPPSPPGAQGPQGLSSRPVPRGGRTWALPCPGLPGPGALGGRWLSSLPARPREPWEPGEQADPWDPEPAAFPAPPTHSPGPALRRLWGRQPPRPALGLTGFGGDAQRLFRPPQASRGSPLRPLAPKAGVCVAPRRQVL